MTLFWSPILARRLADALPDGVLFEAWSTPGAEADAARLRDELCAWTEDDEGARRWLMEAWRHVEGDVVRVTERLAPEQLAGEWPLLVRHCGHERPFLALLSEADEDTEENVAAFFEHLTPGRERKVTAAFWDSIRASVESGHDLRVFVVGGDPSERARVDAIGARHACRVSWIPAVKGRGFGPAQTALSDVAGVDAIVVVTGRISHTLMHGARKAADRLGVPCLFVERLSERQVADTIETIRTSREGAAR